MATVNEKMTALADEVRELSGTTEAMGIDGMTEQVSEANNEVESQTELLAQAVSALSGKAGGEAGIEVFNLLDYGIDLVTMMYSGQKKIEQDNTELMTAVSNAVESGKVPVFLLHEQYMPAHAFVNFVYASDQLASASGFLYNTDSLTKVEVFMSESDVWMFTTELTV